MMNVSESTRKLLVLMPIVIILGALNACRQAAPAANAQPTSVSVKLAAVQSSTLADSSEYVASSRVASVSNTASACGRPGVANLCDSRG